ncbi:uncharacterized protein LOC135943410 [Cloeon dipterum]|uniref:uncharacterized protein LOC135943410 n=1 Tax=Cloeon dipterum TaxID=197152 RepID=UPI00321F7714
MALQIFGVPLMGTMFVPVLSVFILLFVVSQFVAADSRASAENASKLKSTVHTQETSPTNLEKQRNAEETSDSPRLSESSSQLTGDSSCDDSNGADIKKKKKKKSCCGTKGACCKSKKKNSDSEASAEDGEKKCGCSCGSKKEGEASSSESSDVDYQSEVLDVEDLAGLMTGFPEAEKRERVNGVPVGKVRLRVKGRLNQVNKVSPAAN